MRSLVMMGYVPSVFTPSSVFALLFYWKISAICPCVPVKKKIKKNIKPMIGHVPKKAVSAILGDIGQSCTHVGGLSRPVVLSHFCTLLFSKRLSISFPDM